MNMLVAYAVAVVTFGQSSYAMYENNGAVNPTLSLSKQLSFDITVEVKDDGISATG